MFRFDGIDGGDAESFHQVRYAHPADVDFVSWNRLSSSPYREVKDFLASFSMFITNFPSERIALYGVGVAIGYAALAQGAFYADQFVNVVLLFAVTGVAQMIRCRFPSLPAARTAVCALGTLAIWTTLTTSLSGDVSRAAGPVALMLCLAVTVTVTATLSRSARETLLMVILGLGAIVAISCWIGVAYHHEPYALPSQGVWRSASTITYANGAAALLATCLFVALSYIGSGTTSLALDAVTWITAVGWLSTLSRAGFASFAIGLAVFAVLFPGRKGLLSVWPVIIAAVVTYAALLPSLSEGGPAHPLTALAGVLIGAVLLIVSKRHRISALVGIAAIVAVGFVIAWSAGALQEAAHRVVDTRFDARSTDRADLTRVTLRQFRDHPLIGVGSGNIDFTFVNTRGEEVQGEFTHDEYLQLATETGLPGLILALIAIISLCWLVLAGNRPLSAPYCAALAILVALAFHSLFDFLWHIPAVVLLAVAAASTLPSERVERTSVES